MKHKSFSDMNCSLAQTLEVIGERWTLLIIRDAFLGLSRFEDFQNDLGVARNILTARLKRLVDQGILTRQPVTEKGRRYHYFLTQKGQDLLGIVLAYTHWGDKWLANKKGVRLVFTEKATGKAVEPMRVRSKAGTPLTIDQLDVKAGPGGSPHVKALFGIYGD
jgi:DNA-binding HxlR family transcriptional regulator